MNLSVTMVTLSTMKIPLSDLSFLSFLSSQGSYFAVVADLCDYFADGEKYPAKSENRKLGKFTAELKIYF